MKSKEGRLLAGIGFGAAVIAGLIISQIGERPMGWATHLQTFPDPAPAGDTPFVPSPTGDCDEGFSAVIEYLHGRDPSSGDPLDQPTILLRGDWNLVEPFEYSFATRIPRGTLSVDEAGLKAYPVTITRTVDGITSTCVVTFGITGISVGDEFVLDAPCIVEIDTPVSITVKLKDGSTVEIPDDILSPAGSIVPDNGSELHIRRTSDGSSFSDHRFRQGGQEKTGVPVDNQGDPFEFIDEGLYELELIWFEPPPPDGTGPLVEISRAKVKLIAGDPNNVASGISVTISDLFDFFEAPGPACVSTQTVRGALMTNLGTIRCDKISKYASVVDKASIGIDVLNNALPTSSASDLNDATNIVTVAIAKHEANHVTWWNTNFPDKCEDCSCKNVPTYSQLPNPTDAEKASECLAYNESYTFLTSQSSSSATGPGVDAILDKYIVHDETAMNALGCTPTGP